MSRKPKNNHYHFAEQYSDGYYQRKMKAASAVHLPRRAVFFAMFVLLVFGIVTTTFSANISTEEVDEGSILISVRNTKTDRDLVLSGDKSEELAVTGANVDYAALAAVTDLRYNSSTKGWGTNSSVTGNSSGWIPVSFSSASNESFKIYHNGWTDAYFSKSTAAVSLNTEYTLTNSSSHPNMTYSFAAGNYGFKIANPDTYNGMKMTLYHLFDANAVFYIDVSDYWSDDDPEIGGYFCESTSGTATWVKATRCADISNSHLYRLVAPSSAIYSKLVLGRFQKGTTAAQMSFSGSRFYNQSVDILYQATNTKIKLTSYGSGTTTKATVSTSSVTHTHKYYAYEYVRNTPSDSYSLASTLNSNTSVACGTATISLSASDRSGSGYKFDGWYRGTTSGVSNATLVSSNRSYTPTNYSGTSYYYALYTLEDFDIDYQPDDEDDPAATAGAIQNPSNNSVPSGDKKVYGQTYTITSNKYIRQGFTQKGWSTTPNRNNDSGNGYYDFGDTYSTNADLTLYPVWELNTPTISIDSTSSMVVGSTPVDLNLTASDVYDDVTRTYTYNITGPSGHNASVGTDPDDSDTFMIFDADIPGTYSVTITATDVSSTDVINTNNTESATATSTITVLPPAPVFDVTFYGTVDDPNRDGTSTQRAYMVLLGNRYYFSASVDSAYLTAYPTSTYTYEWFWDSDLASAHQINTDTNNDGTPENLTTITFVDKGTLNNPDYRLINYISNHPYDPEADPPDPDPRSMAEESDGSMYSVTLYCRVTHKTNSVSNESPIKQRYYFIQPLIQSFAYEPMQKIFNLNDQTVTLAAEYNVADDPSYTTKLYFSNSNSNDPSDWTLAEQDSGFIHSFANAIRTYLYPSGPKFFYILMNGYNRQGEPIESRSEKVHTTVNTADSSASRSLYIKNTTANSLKNYLVMCYYIDGSGNLRYQVAQDMYRFDDDVNNESTFDNNGFNYRVMVPADATAVRLGFLSTDYEGLHYYGTPTVSSGTIGGFTGPTYYGYSEQFTLSSSTGVITLNSTRVVSALTEYYYNPNP